MTTQTATLGATKNAAQFWLHMMAEGHIVSDRLSQHAVYEDAPGDQHTDGTVTGKAWAFEDGSWLILDTETRIICEVVEPDTVDDYTYSEDDEAEGTCPACDADLLTEDDGGLFPSAVTVCPSCGWHEA